MLDKYYSINIPINIKIIIWKKNEIKIVYLISNNKILKICFSGNQIKIDKWFNSLIIFKKGGVLREEKLKKKIKDFLKSWNLYFFSKIKFKGKGFRIKFFKKIKLIKFYFGKSHKTFVFLKNIFKKKINKYKFLLYSLNKKRVLTSSKIITGIKPINIYTLRGLRNSKQIIYKRKGKKGTYI